MAIITLARARQNAALTDVSDADLTTLINAASAYVERYCDRKFEAATATSEKLDGNDLDYIHVKNNYVTGVTSCTITEGDGTETEIGAGNLGFDNQTDNCRIFFDEDNASPFAFFPWGYQNITITYTYGYDSVPDDVQEACAQMVKNIYSQSSSSRDPALQSERLGEYQYTIRGDMGSASGGSNGGGGILTAQVEQLLASYVRTVF